MSRIEKLPTGSVSTCAGNTRCTFRGTIGALPTPIFATLGLSSSCTVSSDSLLSGLTSWRYGSGFLIRRRPAGDGGEAETKQGVTQDRIVSTESRSEVRVQAV